MITRQEAAKELMADILAVDDREMLCLMTGDAARIARALALMGYRKQEDKA